ncbi:MAG: Uma2 family endonuclease [Armatimonadota bacterium]
MAISLRLAASPTDEEIRTLSARNPGYQFERSAGGELVVTPTGGRSGHSEAELIVQLGNWAKADDTGLVFSSQTGFRLPDGSLLVPDASWVLRERWDALASQEQEDFVPLCPDAVFEIASPSDALSRLRRKSEGYLTNGARVVVLIDPKRRAVEVYTPYRDPAVLESIRSVALGPVLPGFVLDLEALFR